MAANPFDHALPSASFFNIHSDGAILNVNQSALPVGPCNFSNLNQGTNGAKCGCRRFWSRSALGGSPDQTEWCMCSHHACFHEDFRTGTAPTSVPEIPGPGQENEKPKSGRDPLSPVQEVSLQMPSVTGTMDFMNYPTSNPTAAMVDELVPSEEATNANVERDQSIPDTLSWGNFVQSQPGASTLPPVPSQCLMGSQAPSVTSSVQRYLRPFSGRGLNTLSGVNKLREPLQDTDAPGVAANADGTIPDTLPQESAQGSLAPLSVNGDRQPLQPLAGLTRESIKRISDTVTGHEQRLERLENASFSATGQEECQERHENMDVRFAELETRVDEVEKAMNDTGSHVGTRNVDESASMVSVSTSSTTNTHHAEHTEIQSQIQNLRAQISQFAALSPTFGSPWEIEVVLLPFPLKGVWYESSEFPARRQSSTGAVDFQADQWTQIPSSCSASAMPYQSPHLQDWAPQGLDTDWQLPRACAPGKLIDRRLRSRGFIRKVAIKGPDARSVHLAISNAFGNLFHQLDSQRETHFGHRQAKYQGLQEPWVPLRKIHKDSRLRFLTPAEMITSAIWDVKFLSSSVVMKATSIHRLYVTQPGAYFQDDDAYESGWTWQQVREMSRCYSESQSLDEVPEADAKEDCWSWNEALDEAPTPTSSQSLSLRQSHHGQPAQVSSPPTQEFYTGREFPSMSSSRSAHGARKTPMRPAHIRTASMPPNATEMMSPLMRRRVTSSGYERKGSPLPRAIAMSAVTKRRQTRSPSVRPRNTPRWSTASQTPGVEEMRPKRGMTPAAYYATPYSNAPYEQARRGPSVGAASVFGIHMDDDDNDDDRGSATDPNDDSEMAQPDDLEDSEWHGHAGGFGGGGRQPEDEPWPGLPDHPMSDSENVDPLSAAPSGHEDDGASDMSSQPSEYPSTQSAFRGHGPGDFRIHEDDDGMDTIRA
ncbi:uncharacterized protein MKZ38_001053 [Zalerion maritima]|uniref:Uncharacterized protein n=1 Tax=Zalerion maritima TaxID=339359 RepID=A0AAD5WU32_9PEZI|nr:uncharacterized protein MKZ38_001053 [Zalerion maritima]